MQTRSGSVWKSVTRPPQPTKGPALSRRSFPFHYKTWTLLAERQLCRGGHSRAVLEFYSSGALYAVLRSRSQIPTARRPSSWTTLPASFLSGVSTILAKIPSLCPIFGPTLVRIRKDCRPRRAHLAREDISHSACRTEFNSSPADCDSQISVFVTLT